jgi:hypothetical protein
MKKEMKIYLSLAALLIIHLVFIIFIEKNIYPVHLALQNFYILDLMGKTKHLPGLLIYIFELGNIFLLWIISRKFLNGCQSLIPSLVYAISPWGAYLTAAGSFYVFLLLLVLVFIYSLILIKEDTKSFGIILFLSSSLIAIYSSVFFLILVPIAIFLILVFKIVPLNKLKMPTILFVLFALPLLILSVKNHVVVRDVLQNEVSIFDDPGLINTVNSFEGETGQVKMKILGRISENKYVFSGEYLLMKFSEQLVPSTFFTSQERLLDFSFSSPIFLGFLIPFFYGIYLLLKSDSIRKILLVSGLLTIPSLLAQEPVDLNRLVIFMPVVIFVISYGTIKLLEQKGKNKVWILVFSVLVFLQIFITINDIKVREKARFIEYFAQNYEVKQ